MKNQDALGSTSTKSVEEFCLAKPIHGRFMVSTPVNRNAASHQRLLGFYEAHFLAD